MDLKDFRVDLQKEVDGTWCAVGDGAEVLLARIGNKKYLKRVKQVYKPHRRAIQRGIEGEGLVDELMISVLADTILLDWKGIKEDDENVPYNKGTCIRILTDYKDFREMVVELADDMAAFHQAEVDKQVKK